MARAIRNHYFGADIRLSNDHVSEFVDLLSDVVFVYGIDRSAKVQAERSTGKTYFYV